MFYFVVVCVVGYALFSESITITGTATASGSFDIEETCEVVTESNKISNDRYTIGGTGTCTIENGTIKTSSTLTKPGDIVWFRIKLKNTGTIPAVIKSIDSPNNYTKNLKSTGDEVLYNTTYKLVAGYLFENYEDDGAMGNAETEALKITIQPNATENLLIIHEWYDAGSSQTVVPSSGYSMNYNVTLGFEQVTVN